MSEEVSEVASASAESSSSDLKKEKKKKDTELSPEHRVRVAVRVRPFNKADQSQTRQEDVCMRCTEHSVTIDNGERDKTLTYDYVFQGTQDEVFLTVGEQMLQDAFQGYNVTVFAYGQTGSGKTYSMFGGEDDDDVTEEDRGKKLGLLPRICRELFDLNQALVADDPTLRITIQVSFVEVYNEEVRDLLEYECPGVALPTTLDAKNLRKLKIREDRKKKSFFVDELSMHTVASFARIMKLFEVGSSLRTHAITKMNDASSRSHAVFTIYISQIHEPPSAIDPDRVSKITIVDLAGSERLAKTENIDNKRIKEAERINMSLLVLGKCLSACSNPRGEHIPIRESVLTKMLSDIFGGNSKTLMFATVSPSVYNYGESLSTLQYAYDAKKIKHKAVVNNLGKALEIKELKEQVKQLGKTLLEELEKAAKQKDMLDKEIQAISEEKELIASALKSCQLENSLLKQQLEDLKKEQSELRSRTTGGAPGGGGPRKPKKKGDASTSTTSNANIPNLSNPTVPDFFGKEINWGPPRAALYNNDDASGGGGEGDDEGDKEKERKLAEIHAELTAKLHLINPMIQSHMTARSARGGEKAPDTARAKMISAAMGNMTARGSSSSSSSAASYMGSTNEIRSYIGHAAAVYSCCFSNSGDLMASASRDRTVKIWNVRTGSEILTIKGHSGFVLSCAFSPNGNEIMSASEDKTIRVSEVATGKKTLVLKGHSDKIYCVTYSPSGEHIASASCDKTVRVWESASGKKSIILKGHTSAVFSVAFSHSGAKLVSASDDKTLRIWDWVNSAELNTLQGHTATVWSCEFSPKDDLVLSSSLDGTLKLWDSETSFVVRTFRGHSAPVHHAIFAKDGTRVVSASRDRTLKVWETDTGKVLSTLIGHTNTVYHCAVYNNLVLSCSSDDILKVWNLKSG